MESKTTAKKKPQKICQIAGGEPLKIKMNLLVFSGLVLEVVDGLPEESDAEQTAVVVFKQQSGGEEMTHYYIHRSETISTVLNSENVVHQTRFSSFKNINCWLCPHQAAISG